MDNRSFAFLIAALFFLVAPLDVPQLIMALAGAIVYALFQALPKMQISNAKQMNTDKGCLESSTFKDVNVAPCPAPDCHDSTATRATGVLAKRKPTAAPIPVPVFKVADFNKQVDELLLQIVPTPACNKAVADIVRIVKQALRPFCPEAEVHGFACGNLSASTAYGVAVPELDIVLSAKPTELTKQLQGRLAIGGRIRDVAPGKLDMRKVQKSTVRVCTSLLVSAGFKFRRSSFRSTEPKVTVMAPASLGVHSEAVPVDFSVNNTIPFSNSALIAECGQIEPRAKELILLVRRWVKDRGICHASKGHLPPYAWSLLVIYFLQVGVTDESPLLPPLEEFAKVSGLIARRRGYVPVCRAPRPKPSSEKALRNTVGDLFKQFILFYAEKIVWGQEVISVRLGKRTTPSSQLNTHVVVNDDGSRAVSPIIEDPFDATHNVGACTNQLSLKRLFEEFDRAKELMANNESLSKLLEHWRPPDVLREAECEGDAVDEDEA